LNGSVYFAVTGMNTAGAILPFSWTWLLTAWIGHMTRMIHMD